MSQAELPALPEFKSPSGTLAELPPQEFESQLESIEMPSIYSRTRRDPGGTLRIPSGARRDPSLDIPLAPLKSNYNDSVPDLHRQKEIDDLLAEHQEERESLKAAPEDRSEKQETGDLA